jgi:4-oxalocrotonate tautomerase
MPFVNIRILEGQSQENKDEISRRVTEAITDVTGLPKEAVWIVYEGVGASDWYVGATTVTELRKRKS